MLNMPKGTPTALELLHLEVTFFSLDTDVIQSAGYNFDEGALNQLPKQLPADMQLQLSAVVLEEIVRHRMEGVHEAADALQAASAKLLRLAETPMAAIDAQFQELNVRDAAAERFRQQVRAYAERCRGDILDIQGEDLSADLFKLYFAQGAPFGKRKDKKSEFPDATSLLLLEAYAKANNTKGIVASMDAGWEAFAADSEHLYCVDGIDKLAALFKATDEHATAIKTKIAAAINDADSALRQRLDDALERHVENSSWDASDIYGSSMRVEPEVYGTEVADYTLEMADVSIWPVGGEPTSWVVELIAAVKANIDVSVQFYVWDSIDREELSMGSRIFTYPREFRVDAYLTCDDVDPATEPEAWHVEVDIAPGNYGLGSHEVEQDFDPD